MQTMLLLKKFCLWSKEFKNLSLWSQESELDILQRNPDSIPQCAMSSHSCLQDSERKFCLMIGGFKKVVLKSEITFHSEE